jgi:hypothetical protein
MNEHTQKLLNKSLDVLEAAEILLSSGKTREYLENNLHMR